MRNKLEINLMDLKEKLAAVDRKIQVKPGSRYLIEVRNSYIRAINSAETTMDYVRGLDPKVLNNVARLKRKQEVF